LIKIIILEENFKWHLEAFASELFKYTFFLYLPVISQTWLHKVTWKHKHRFFF